jgi:hypothetical protein
VALGIAVHTYLDDIRPEDSPEDKSSKLQVCAEHKVPHATHLKEDLDIAFSFFDAVYAGVKTLEVKEIAAADRDVWDNAAGYLEQRRLERG